MSNSKNSLISFLKNGSLGLLIIAIALPLFNYFRGGPFNAIWSLVGILIGIVIVTFFKTLYWYFFIRNKRKNE